MVLQKKKRNQHLVETACTLLRNKIRDLQSSSIGYLINRVPSSILHSQAPNSPLYPQQDLCCCFYPQHQLYIVFADAIILDFPLLFFSWCTWCQFDCGPSGYSTCCPDSRIVASAPPSLLTYQQWIKFQTKLHSTDPLTLSSTLTTLLPTSYTPELPIELHTWYMIHVFIALAILILSMFVPFHFIVYLLPSLLCLWFRLCLFLSL